MHSLDDIYRRIAALVEEVDESFQGTDPDDLRGKHLAIDVGLDSLDIIKFVLQVEESMGVKLADELIDERELLKVDNLVQYLHEQLSEAG